MGVFGTNPQPTTSPSTAIFLQDACLQHKYIRTRDSSHIVERPERLRAVKIGLSAAISRLEESLPITTNATAAVEDSEADSLVDAIENLRLEQDSAEPIRLPKGHPVQVLQSSAKVDILNHPAVKYIHGDVDGDVYLEKLVDWARHSVERISNGGSEIPSGLPQGDLYSNFDFRLDSYRVAHRIYSMSDVSGRDSRGSRYSVRSC
jgi:histone deacetylase HOS3